MFPPRVKKKRVSYLLYLSLPFIYAGLWLCGHIITALMREGKYLPPKD